MRVLSIVHERDAPSGVFADAASAWGAELVQWIPAEAPAPSAPFGAVLCFGGAMNVDQESEHPWLAQEKRLLRACLAERVPLLGVCLGAQLLAEVSGGEARRLKAPEIGWLTVELACEASEDELLGALPLRFESFQWHSYELVAPEHAQVLARSARCVQAFRLRGAPAWGIQFHAEARAQTIAGWIRSYREDADAARAPLDWPELLARTQHEVGRWNELGVGLCKRFLELAAASEPVL